MSTHETDRPVNRGINRLKTCRHGDMIFNVHDQHIGRSLDLYGEWAESELELLGLFIKPGDVVIDVGANIGTHTVFFAQRAGATGQVQAFEPQRIVFQNLCANLALNGLLNVRAFHAAVVARGGDDRGAAGRLRRARQPRWRRARGGRAPVAGRRARAGDDARRPRPRRAAACSRSTSREWSSTCSRAGASLIAAARPIVYLENNDAAKSPALISWLLARDYHLFWHVSRFFNPRNFFANAGERVRQPR